MKDIPQGSAPSTRASWLSDSVQPVMGSGDCIQGASLHSQCDLHQGIFDTQIGKILSCLRGCLEVFKR